MTGAQYLALHITALGRLRRARLERVLEHEADRGGNVRQEIDASMERILKRIKRLPERAAAESRSAFERMRERILGEVAAMPSTISDAVMRRFERSWMDEIGRYADELERRHRILDADARALGAKLGGAPAAAIDLDIAPPAPDPGKDPRGLYTDLREKYGEEPMERVANILDSIKRGRMGANDGKLAIAHIVDQPAHRAEAIMRTEIGRAAQEANQDAMDRIGERRRGLAKEWSSARLRSSREGHLEAHGQVVPHDEPFLVRPDYNHAFERLMYPGDPRGSAGNVVNCACVSVPRVEALVVKPAA